jgi:hypothetical protein
VQLRLIDVAIGLVATFFLIALISSALVEAGSMIFKKRSKDLEVVIAKMLADPSAKISLQDTSVFAAINAATRRKRGPGKDRRFPSYLSARAFVDAVFEAKAIGDDVEGLAAKLPTSPFKQRVEAMFAEGEDDLMKIKAGLESWFDDTMDRLSGSYKRWSQWLLLIVGLALATILNVSAIRILDTLWNDSTLRTAVASQSVDLTDTQCPTDNKNCTQAEKIETAINSLDALKLPVGWGDTRWDPNPLGTIVGWVVVGAATMLGAPFWYDALKRLAGLRAGRGVPPRAADDPTSATVSASASNTTATISLAAPEAAPAPTEPPANGH